MTVLDNMPPPKGKQAPVGFLLASAFTEARSRYAELNASWIRISFLVGSRLPASLMSVSIQREGEVDLVIRCIEDEVAQMVATQQDDPLFVANYLNLMSTYWIGGMYETFRLLRERKLAGDDQRFSAIFTDLELLRIPLEKHEIAKDRTLTEPLTLIRNPPKDERDTFSYARDDPKRSHIMPMGVSPRGSMMWQPTDVKAQTSKWIERRTLSDRILDLWK